MFSKTSHSAVMAHSSAVKYFSDNSEPISSSCGGIGRFLESREGHTHKEREARFRTSELGTILIGP
jgi:hypothetical protein